jgi:hypothetical protein
MLIGMALLLSLTVVLLLRFLIAFRPFLGKGAIVRGFQVRIA